jgi:hypothetical protein
MILKGSEQYWKTPAVRTITGPRSSRGTQRVSRKAKALSPRRNEPMSVENLDLQLHLELERPGRLALTPREEAAPRVPPPSDPQAFVSWEIATALDIALPEGPPSEAKLMTPEDIERALSQVFPDDKEQGGGSSGQASSLVFDIPYDFELKCLRATRSIDPNWVPAGMIYFPDARGENRG